MLSDMIKTIHRRVIPEKADGFLTSGQKKTIRQRPISDIGKSGWLFNIPAKNPGLTYDAASPAV